MIHLNLFGLVISSSDHLLFSFAIINYILHFVYNCICRCKWWSHIINLSCTSLRQKLDWYFGIDIFHYSYQFVTAEREYVLHERFNLSVLCELIGAICQKQLSDFKVEVRYWITKFLTVLALLLLHFWEVIVLEPVRDFHLALLSLLKVDSKPKWHTNWLSWLEWPICSANEAQLFATEIRLNINRIILSKEFVFSGSPALEIHI